MVSFGFQATATEVAQSILVGILPYGESALNLILVKTKMGTC